MISYVDTDEIDKIADEVMSATRDLESEFDALYKRLANVPRGTKEWIGNQADFYFSVIVPEKKQYVELIEKIRQISMELKREATEISSSISMNNTSGNGA
jgi:uncharacterized protein YukE